MFAAALMISAAAHATTTARAALHGEAPAGAAGNVQRPLGGAHNVYSGTLARRGNAGRVLKRRRSRQRRCEAHPEITRNYHTFNEGRMRCSKECDGAFVWAGRSAYPFRAWSCYSHALALTRAPLF